MTALTLLSSLVCEGYPATFRYTPQERRSAHQAAWDLRYTDASGAERSVACCGCNGIRYTGTNDPELLAQAELRHQIGLRRKAARVERDAEASELSALHDITARIAHHAIEAARHEAQANSLESALRSLAEPR
jgi:hypothetical protein